MVDHIDPQQLTVFNGSLFFTADDGAHGTQLWKTDGTTAGTAMVTDVGGVNGLNPADFTIVGGTMFFVANGSELWKTDGTPCMIADM
jgi:ELWxxDGT repeat protein